MKMKEIILHNIIVKTKIPKDRSLKLNIFFEKVGVCVRIYISVLDF